MASGKGKDIHKEAHRAVGRVIVLTERSIERSFREMISRVVRRLPLVNRGLVKGNGVEWVDLRQHPMFRKAIHEEVGRMLGEWASLTAEGVRRAWAMGEEESDKVVSSYFARRRGVPKSLMESYKQRNERARRAFESHTREYSQRVWQKDALEGHLQTSIAEALAEGVPATELARKIKQDLRYPDKLFRRVRNKYGDLVLSKNARAFHPGRGVYRSSYKNAMRLARTEINTAYRTADHERWQRLDFVKGVRVQLSNNHTCNGVPFRDICDDLAGIYPKDFKFTGWHPQCRCIATPILEDFGAFMKRRAEGREAPEGLTDMPLNFKQWAKDNSDRIARAGRRGTLPYFLKDNGSLIEYHNHDPKKWEKTAYYHKSQGYLVRDKTRVQNGQINKQERYKLEKETRMAHTFARAGYKIELLNEIPGTPSPDALIDGIPADFKSTKGHGNIVKYAHKAVTKQQAKIVLFEFEEETQEIHKELLQLKNEGYNVLYYFRGKGSVYKL